MANLKFKSKKEKKLGFGGDLGGGIGTVAGSFIPIPGIGPAIGGVAGKGIGNTLDNIIGRKKRARKAAALEESELNANAEQGSLGFAQFKNGGKLSFKYAKGGKLTNIAAGALKVQGPSHANGGVKLPQFGAEVEGGETIANVDGSPFVFSDRIKVPGSKITFADAHEKGAKAGVGQQFVKNLAKNQEKVKGGNHENTSLGDAGRLQAPNRFADGGFMKGAPLRPLGSNSLGRIIQPDELRQAPKLTPLSTTGGGSLLNRDNLEKIAPFLGPGANIFSGLIGGNKAATTKFNPIDKGSVRKLQNLETNFNIQPALNEIRRNQATLASNPAASSNERLAAHAQGLEAGSRLQGQKQNIETQLRNAKTSAIARETGRLNTIDNQNRLRVDSANALSRSQARAANLGLINTGVAQVGATVQQQKKDRELAEMEPLRLASALATGDPDTAARVLEILKSTAPDKHRAVIEQMSDQFGRKPLPSQEPKLKPRITVQ